MSKPVSQKQLTKTRLANQRKVLMKTLRNLERIRAKLDASVQQITPLTTGLTGDTNKQLTDILQKMTLGCQIVDSEINQVATKLVATLTSK